jgi:hypothetical protein
MNRASCLQYTNDSASQKKVPTDVSPCSNQHLWPACQCVSNTSSTWYDIGLKKHRRIKAGGWCEEEAVNLMHEATGPRRRPISGADRLAV